MNNLAELLRRQGKYEQAQMLLASVVASRRRVLGAQHRDTAVSLALLGRVRVDQESYAEAESPLREALTAYEKAAPDEWRRYLAQGLLGASLAGQRKYAEAEPLLLAGYQGMLQRQGSVPADSRSAAVEAAEWIGRLYQDWDKPEKAAGWREKISEHLTAERSGGPVTNGIE
jgi:eukaryotic-like serine/threonine-protein kinase